MCSAQLLSHVSLFATLWTGPARLLCSWDSPGQTTGVRCHALLPGSSLPRNQTGVSCSAGRFFLSAELLRKPKVRYTCMYMVFSPSSVSKESSCNVGDMGSIPGSGRSPGEGNGYPLQYSCLVIPMDRGTCWARVHGVTRVCIYFLLLLYKS